MEGRASAGEFDGFNPRQLQQAFGQLVDFLPRSNIDQSNGTNQRAGSELQTAGFLKMRELLQSPAVSDFFKEYLLNLYRRFQTEGVSRESVEFEHFKLITTHDPDPLGEDDASIEEIYLRDISMPYGLVTGIGKLRFSPNFKEDTTGGIFNPERASDFEVRAYMLELSAMLAAFVEVPRVSNILEFQVDGVEKMVEWKRKIIKTHNKTGFIGELI